MYNNHIKEFCNSCKAAECSHCHLMQRVIRTRSFHVPSCFNKSLNSTDNIEFPFFSRYMIQQTYVLQNRRMSQNKNRICSAIYFQLSARTDNHSGYLFKYNIFILYLIYKYIIFNIKNFHVIKKYRTRVN